MLPLLLVAVALLAWEAAVQGQLVSRLLFPAPSTILAGAWKMGLSGALPRHTLLTVSRLGLGILIGGSAGLLLGLLMGWQRRLHALLDPFVAAAHPIPKIAIFPLILVFFGLGETSKIVVTSMAAFFPVIINTVAGVRSLPPIYLDVARNYGASRWLTLWRVILPASLPFVLAGFVVAVNITLLLTIAVEMITARDGLGAMIWLAWQTMRTEEVYISLGVIMCLGILSNLFFQGLSRSLVPWQPER